MFYPGCTSSIFSSDYSNFNESNFISELQTLSWEGILENCSDVNDMCQLFYSTISMVVDKHVPLKRLSGKEIKFKDKPWITKGIKKSMNIKNKFFRLYMRTKKVYYHTKFKFYRNKLKHLINLSKKTYYHIYNNKSKEIWKGVKQLITIRKSNQNYTSKVKQGNVTIIDKKQIANAFNIYFANIGNKLAESIPASNESFRSFLSLSITESFFIFPTSPEEIQKEIELLNTRKSIGLFSIPVKLLKMLKHLLSETLSLLFNYSFSSGVVPNQLKIARVIPIYKKGSCIDLTNYRPISLLSIFNKILEKLMYRRLLSFLDKHNVLFDKHFGFRSYHSTNHAILLICDKIQRAIENGSYSCGIFLDLSKAFYTIDHQILFSKLHYYGIRGVAADWFRSYLYNRRQYVSIIICCIYCI